MKTFSLIHATYGRPAKATSAMEAVISRLADWASIEYIWACDEEDAASVEASRDACWAYAKRVKIKAARGKFGNSVAAWNAAAELSTGQILIQMQDDLELPQDWDGILMEWLEGANTNPNWWRDVPLVLTVKDGYRKDALLCTAICNRARYKQQGEFLHAGYQSVFSDDEFSIRAYADEADGKCQIIRTDSVFTHRHCYHDKTVPEDATYRRENSSEAYAKGGALFAERNAHLVARGFKTW